MFIHVDSEDPHQTGWMPRLICLPWAQRSFVGFVIRQLKCVRFIYIPVFITGLPYHSLEKSKSLKNFRNI